MAEHVPPCVYRDLADEAYLIDPETGQEKLIDVWLCTWPTTLGAKPQWVERAINGGFAIEPDRDCPQCPVRLAQPREEPL